MYLLGRELYLRVQVVPNVSFSPSIFMIACWPSSCWVTYQTCPYWSVADHKSFQKHAAVILYIIYITAIFRTLSLIGSGQGLSIEPLPLHSQAALSTAFLKVKQRPQEVSRARLWLFHYAGERINILVLLQFKGSDSWTAVKERGQRYNEGQPHGTGHHNINTVQAETCADELFGNWCSLVN